MRLRQRSVRDDRSVWAPDASVLQAIAPCVVMGPGDIGVAHKPGEAVRIDELAAAVPVFQALAVRLAR